MGISLYPFIGKTQLMVIMKYVALALLAISAVFLLSSTQESSAGVYGGFVKPVIMEPESYSPNLDPSILMISFGTMAAVIGIGLYSAFRKN